MHSPNVPDHDFKQLCPQCLPSALKSPLSNNETRVSFIFLIILYVIFINCVRPTVSVFLGVSPKPKQSSKKKLQRKIDPSCSLWSTPATLPLQGLALAVASAQDTVPPHSRCLRKEAFPSHRICSSLLFAPTIVLVCVPCFVCFCTEHPTWNFSLSVFLFLFAFPLVREQGLCLVHHSVSSAWGSAWQAPHKYLQNKRWLVAGVFLMSVYRNLAFYINWWCAFIA